MDKIISYLNGGDLRSIAKVEEIIPLIKTQVDFDELFRFLFSSDRLLVMRAADAVEKISLTCPQFLSAHKKEINNFLHTAADKEFKWHIALIVSRVDLSEEEQNIVWNRLSGWATDKKESKIVRVNSLQSLNDFAKQNQNPKDFI